MMKFTFERFLLVAALIAAAFFGIRGCMSQKEEKKEIQQVAIHKDDSLQHYKDEAGREHAYRLAAEGRAETLDLFYGSLMDSVLRALNTTSKRLDVLAAVGTQATGRVGLARDTIYLDGKPIVTLNGSDGYLTLFGQDNDTLDYRYQDSMIIAAYFKKRPFFKGGIWGNRDLVADAYSLNPNATITGLTYLKFNPLQHDRFRLDLYGGGGTRNNNVVPMGGLSTQVNLSQRTALEFQGGYNLQRGQLITEFNGRLKLTLVKF